MIDYNPVKIFLGKNAFFVLSISDDAMEMIISAILSRRPKKELIRPGTPWYRAKSPVPDSSLLYSNGEDKQQRSESLDKKTDKCC